MEAVAARRDLGRSVFQAPALVLLACAVVLLAGDRAGLPAMRHLRVAYALAVTTLLVGGAAGARRWNRPWPPSLAWGVAVFTAIELVVPIWYELQHHALTNRLEHFTAFVLLTQLSLVLARWRGPVGQGTRALLAAGLTAIGFANEGIEYLFRWGTPFFSPDTILDLTMNSSALLLVLLWDARRESASPKRLRPPGPSASGEEGAGSGEPIEPRTRASR